MLFALFAAKKSYSGDVDMSSEARLHVAIFPSVRAIANMGGGKMLFNRIEGRYSKNLVSTSQKVSSRFIQGHWQKIYKQAIISWNVEKDPTHRLATIQELLLDLEENEIIDMALKEITFVLPTIMYNNDTLQNENYYLQWTFRPYTFRPTVWRRLKASKNFPARNLYLQSLKKKRELQNESQRNVFKRWKDVLLVNDKEEHTNLENYEIRQLWMDKKFAMLLKETKGDFELMDLGDWKL